MVHGTSEVIVKLHIMREKSSREITESDYRVRVGVAGSLYIKRTISESILPEQVTWQHWLLRHVQVIQAIRVVKVLLRHEHVPDVVQ